MIIKLCGGADGLGDDNRLRKVHGEASSKIAAGWTPYKKMIYFLVSGKGSRELVFSPSSATNKLYEPGQFTFLSGYFLILKNTELRPDERLIVGWGWAYQYTKNFSNCVCPHFLPHLPSVCRSLALHVKTSVLPGNHIVDKAPHCTSDNPVT